MTARIVAGIDAGATHTRCVVVDERGRLLGASDGAGANPNSSAAPVATLRDALRSAGVAAVDVLVVGAAGGGPAGVERLDRLVRESVDEAGVTVGRLVVHSDVEVAFAAGSVHGDGTVVIAGTGAVAARMRDFSIVRRVDGNGYLLGDRGSAVWLGLAALRAAVDAMEGVGPATALESLVLAAVDRTRLDGVPAIVAEVYGRSPADIGRFGPLVDEAVRTGDDVAQQIVARAIAFLVSAAHATGGSAPIVVAGAVATGAGPVGAGLRARLARDYSSEPVLVTGTRRGAAALALRALDDPPLEVASRIVTEGLG